MRSLIHQIAEASGKIGTVLVVGAGQGADLASLRRLGARRLVLVEADPRLADMLVQRIDAGRGEEVLSLAVTAGADRQADLHLVSLSRHSSLLAPEGLFDYFPNLQVTEVRQVPARSLTDLVQGLDLDDAANHLLVLDVPGLAGSLLRDTLAEELQRFQAIVARDGAEPLYAGEVPLADALASPGRIGFDLVAEDAEAIFPHRAVRLSRNEAVCRAQVREHHARVQEQVSQLTAEREQLLVLAREREELSARVAELTRSLQESDAAARSQARLVEESAHRIHALSAQVTELQQALQARSAEAETYSRLSIERQQLVEKLTAELGEDRDAASRRTIGLEAKLAGQVAECEAATRRARENDGLIQSLTREKVAAETRATELKALLDKKNEEFEAQVKLANARHAQIQSANQQRDACVREIAVFEGRLKAAAAESEAQAKLASDRLAELAEFRQVVALSVRMQTLREADLKDLQSRYEAVHRQSEEQRELLSKLTDRLRIASGYFHQLSAQAEPAPPRPLLVDADPAPRRPPRTRTAAATGGPSRKPVISQKKGKSEPGGKGHGKPASQGRRPVRKGG